MHHALDDHGHRVDPGQRHEERQRAVQDPQEPGETPPDIPPLAQHSWATVGPGTIGHDQPCATSPVQQCCRTLGCVPHGSRGGHSTASGSRAAPAHLHIVHIAGVGHLLDVNPCSWGSPSLHPHHCLLHQVLNVDEAPPDVAQVIEGISCRAWVPKPGGRARCWDQGSPFNQHRLLGWSWRQTGWASPNLSLILLVLVTSSMSMRIL